MVTFRHRRTGQTVTAEPGTKRYDIFKRARHWEAHAAPVDEEPGTPPVEPLEAPPVDELRKRAAELDIPGRSGMNKAELVQAIAEHEAGQE